MKIYILSDNFAGPRFLAEHGLSYLIETQENFVLLDTGASDVFLKNAVSMNVNIADVKTVVLSHGHWDHANGLIHLEDKKLITHQNSFIKRYRKINNEYIGMNLSFEQAKEKFDIHTSSKPLQIFENLFYLGEIPRIFDFEKWQTPYYDQTSKDDYIPDDSAIAVVENNQLIVVTGCSHSGICNIIEYAKKVTGINKVKAVIGGFHLKENNLQTQKTIEYLKNEKVAEIMPSHCTQLPALVAFYNEFKIQQIKTGMIINL